MNGFDPISAHLIPVWIDERCDVEKFARERAGALWDDWRAWAAARRRQAGTPAEFAHAMEMRGYQVDQLAGERTTFRWGLQLKGGGR